MPINPNYKSTRSGYIDVVRDFGAQGDGLSDDTAAINAALLALNQLGGGTVFLPEGTYIVSSDLVVSYNNIHIKGAGRATIIQAAANSVANCIKITGASHVVVSDLQIDGNKANVQQLATQYTKLSGVFCQNSDDITVTNCFIHDCYVSGVMCNGGCTNINIFGNRFTANYDNQVYVRALNTSPYTICSGVTIANNLSSGGSFSGIATLGSSYITVANNVCHDNGPTAAQGSGYSNEGSSYVTVSGNVMYNNGIQGIHIRFSDEVGITHIQSQHVTVSGNVCFGHTSGNGDAGGIAIDDTDDIVLQGNIVTGNQFGININGGSGLGVMHAQLIGNNVRGNSNTGIRVAPGNASDFLLQDNYVTDNADGVYVTTAVLIQGGIYTRAGTNKEGIHCATGSDNTIIDGAFIFDNADNGILIDSPVANVEIRNCYFDNIVGSNQKRALQEQAGAGPTRMVNCRIRNQHNNNYTFNNTSSGYYDEQSYATKTITGTYTIGAHDEVILCNSGTAFTVTLPTVANSNGRALIIKDKSGAANTNTITVSGANNIDGAGSKIINTAYGSLRLVCDGNNWFTI